MTVYRIDLMKFGLLKQNLQGITAINLAGVAPLHERQEKLGDGRDWTMLHHLSTTGEDVGCTIVYVN